MSKAPTKAELKADCEAMASWFVDLINDFYEFGKQEQHAYLAAIKHVPVEALKLWLNGEDNDNRVIAASELSRRGITS